MVIHNLSLEISESLTSHRFVAFCRWRGSCLERVKAQIFTSIGNEHSQIVSFVLTCEGSTECLEPMDRFQQANQHVPKIFYVDCGCCRAQGRAAVETLFQGWVDNGMVVHLDIFHWIHRFDAFLTLSPMKA